MASATLMFDADGKPEFIIVDTMWNEKDLMASVPGSRWDHDLRKWRVPATWAACLQLRGVFQNNLEVKPALNDWAFDQISSWVEPAMQLREQIHPDPDVTQPVDGLFGFQAVGQQFLRTARGVILGDEMGTGKTITALAAIRALGDAAFPALIVCPNGVKANWKREIQKWLPSAHPVVIEGSQTQKRRLFGTPAHQPNSVVIINIEALRLHSRLAPYSSIALQRCRECDKSRGKAGISASRCEVHPKELNHFGFKVVVVDEAHRILDPRAKQTRAVWAVAHTPSVTHRWAMTGTPIANNPGEIWSLLHFVAPQEFPTRSKFNDRYCAIGYDQEREVVALHPHTRDEFYRILHPRFRCIPKALVLQDLPAKLRSTRVVEMTSKQKKAYEEMERTMLTRLESNMGDAFMAASSNLARRVRLLQLASSYADVTTEDGETFKVKLCEPSPKVDALVEILEETGDKQIVVCAESRQLIELAAKRLTKLGISHVLITGAITQWERTKNLNEFQAGKHRVMLFTVKAGGVGLTMTAADTIVFLGRSDSVIDNKQAEDRVHRIGAEHHENVHIIDVVTKGTIEDDQILLIIEKLKRLDEITEQRRILMENGVPVDHLDAETSTILRLSLSNLELEQMRGVVI